jgi:hypothetical protein
MGTDAPSNGQANMLQGHSEWLAEHQRRCESSPIWSHPIWPNSDRLTALISVADDVSRRPTAPGGRHLAVLESRTALAGVVAGPDRVMYLRFVVAHIDEDSERELRVFHAVMNLRVEEKLHHHEEQQHDSIREWFNEHLEKPARFTASKPPFYRKRNRAISWFKDTAHDHLAHVRELVAILEHHGVSVRMLKANRVGYIVYEDEFQIVAEPFADTRR